MGMHFCLRDSTYDAFLCSFSGNYSFMGLGTRTQ
jgi:hypothetical protein